MSGFCSLKAIVKELAGKLIAHLVKERFNNLEAMKHINCPVFIIHGKLDTTINYQQSVELYNELSKTNKRCQIVTPDNMTHIELDF